MECIDPETGEIDAERYDALSLEKKQKLENIALWIKNLKAEAKAYKAEKQAFAERQKAAENKAERLKALLSDELEGKKFKTPKVAVTFRTSKASEIVDENVIPSEFLVTTIAPDKRKILAALKDGEEVKGCRLVDRLSVQVK